MPIIKRDAKQINVYLSRTFANYTIHEEKNSFIVFKNSDSIDRFHNSSDLEINSPNIGRIVEVERDENIDVITMRLYNSQYISNAEKLSQLYDREFPETKIRLITGLSNE
ncbi:MAG: hypothetical protein ABIC91_04170 [Nanoarchaeota archaeon]|nr:hypothetical protein [Nanoarchaeota archaeon]MBU1031282.1 hypothetical protein [Nanoarchaeota archaeon]MBU1849512.1 hypothetical protein [Nanoarchaeota archaeon]